MSEKRRRYNGLKADLAAANAEVRQVMDDRDYWKAKTLLHYQHGYQDASKMVESVVAINRSQAELLAYYVGLVTSQKLET